MELRPEQGISIEAGTKTIRHTIYLERNQALETAILQLPPQGGTDA
jgi:hypothetical protein